MTRSIDLPDEVYEILEQTAATGGITPTQWIARYLAAFGDDPGPDPDTGASRTSADVLTAHVGRGMFSERCNEIVAENDGAAQSEAGGGGTAKPRNMAERLAGRLGRFSGSGGLPSSDNVAQSFAEHLEAKQREGTP